MFWLFFVFLLLGKCIAKDFKGEECVDITVKNTTLNSVALNWTLHESECCKGFNQIKIMCKGINKYMDTDGHFRAVRIKRTQHYPIAATRGMFTKLRPNMKLNCRFTLTQTTEPLIENFRKFEFYTQLAAPEPPQKPDVVKSGIEGHLFTIELHNTTTRNGPIGGYEVQFHSVDKVPLDENDAPSLHERIYIPFGTIPLAENIGHSNEPLSFCFRFDDENTIPKYIVINETLLNGKLRKGSSYIVATSAYTRDENNLLLYSHSTPSIIFTIPNAFQVSNGTIEPLHQKMQTFRQRYGERALYIGITALPVGIILLLIIIAYFCGKIKSEWRRKQREEHYSRMRRTIPLIPPPFLRQPQAVCHSKKNSTSSCGKPNHKPCPRDLSRHSKSNRKTSMTSSIHKATLNDTMITHAELTDVYETPVYCHEGNENQTTLESHSYYSLPAFVQQRETVPTMRNEYRNVSCCSCTPTFLPTIMEEKENPVIRTEYLDTVPLIQLQNPPTLCQPGTILKEQANILPPSHYYKSKVPVIQQLTIPVSNEATSSFNKKKVQISTSPSLSPAQMENNYRVNKTQLRSNSSCQLPTVTEEINVSLPSFCSPTEEISMIEVVQRQNDSKDITYSTSDPQIKIMKPLLPKASKSQTTTENYNRELLLDSPRQQQKISSQHSDSSLPSNSSVSSTESLFDYAPDLDLKISDLLCRNVSAPLLMSYLPSSPDLSQISSSFLYSGLGRITSSMLYITPHSLSESLSDSLFEVTSPMIELKFSGTDSLADPNSVPQTLNDESQFKTYGVNRSSAPEIVNPNMISNMYQMPGIKTGSHIALQFPPRQLEAIQKPRGIRNIVSQQPQSSVHALPHQVKLVQSPKKSKKSRFFSLSCPGFIKSIKSFLIQKSSSEPPPLSVTSFKERNNVLINIDALRRVLTAQNSEERYDELAIQMEFEDNDATMV